MADNQYKILLGTKLDISDIQGQVNDASKSIKPIQIKVDAETKELTNTIKEALKSLSTGTKNALTLDTSKLEVSLNEVTSAIKGIKASIDTLDGATGKITQVGAKIKQSFSISDDFEKLKSLAKEISNLRVDILKSDDTSDISKARVELDRLNSEYDELLAKTKGSLSNKQLSQLGNLVNQGDSKVLREFNNELNEFIKLQNQIENTRFEIGKFEVTGGKENEIETLKKQLEELENTYGHLMNTFMKKASANGDIVHLGDFSNLENGIENAVKKAENRLARFKSQYADTRTELAKGIKFDIEAGNYDNQISQMDDKFNKLSYASKELRESVEQVKNAYMQMELALEGTGDEVADRERLIQAEKEYARALETTNNLLRIQTRTEKADNNRLKLDDDINVFQSKIDAWLTKNSAATKQFGATMLDLKAKAEGVDRVTLNHLEKEFRQVDNAAEKAGLKGLSTFDKIKSKFKEYMGYISVAEVFMYAEQGLREMFEQVKLIDSAMTELKKVTNETDVSYNQFLSNAASRAKELGITIDGLVSSAADFARLGYGFDEVQGLAEVANIYAVVGDDIDSVETATQSLISTLTAFKDEAKDLSNEDFSLSIVDKMNEVSNNFAISSGGIGEALQRSASSMQAANNSLDETIALITAANTVVQDPEQVGTAFKTISMRIKIHCPQ